MFGLEEYQHSAATIKEHLGDFTPEFLLILGSGLGFLAEDVGEPITIEYKDVPHMKAATAPGHRGRFVFGTLGGKSVMMMQGRMHLYEGYTPEEVAYPVRVARLLGASSMIVTNATGGINLSYKVGDLVALSDFIRLSFPSPLHGTNIDAFGPRFCDMSTVFDRDYRALLHEVAAAHGIPLHDGVYYYSSGPQYETPAEIRAMRTLGGDVVGMSTVPECIAANHAGMRIVGVSLVTNMAAGVLDQPLSEEEVLREADRAKVPFSQLIVGLLEKA